MKIHLMFLFCVLQWSSILLAQWDHIATLENNDLYDIKFFNENTGIVAGTGGVWRTINGGVNWIQVLNSQNMRSISFPENLIGYVVGDSGKVFRSTDGGISWNACNINTVYNLNGVSFFTQTIGFTVGDNGIIFKTTNGGVSWNQNNSQLNINLISVQMVQNQNTAFAVGSNVGEYFMSTANGGFNWITTLSNPNNSIYSVNYIPGLNGNLICVGGNGRIRKTTNFGGSWTLISGPATNNFYDVYFIDANTGYITGDVSIIIKTTNSGNNWYLQSTPTSSRLYTIYFINLNTGWAAGAQGNILRTGIPVGNSNINLESPGNFKIYENYPNPFNPEANITFEIPVKCIINITLYDILGNMILYFVKNEFFEEGKYSIPFDGKDLPSGVYFYNFNAVYREGVSKTFNQSAKMILLK